MTKHLPLLAAYFFCAAAYTQTPTVLHSQTFESGGAGYSLNTTDMGGTATGENPWIINNVYAGGGGTFPCQLFPFPFPPSDFPFLVPPAATQPAGITNSPTSTYLHITPQIAINVGGTAPTASYVTADATCIFGGTSTFTKMSSDVSTIGQDSVTLDLWWMCGGNTIYYGELFYSTNGGMAWTPVNCPVTGTSQWINQTTWTNSIIWNANWDNQATLRFGFRFTTASTTIGGEADPGFAVDDIEITGYVNGPSCTPTSSSFNLSACDSQASPSGLYTWTVDGTYNDTIPNVDGCDSVMTITVDINTVDNGASVTGYSITADQAGGTYQWLDCNNAYAVVPGATSQTFNPAVDGDYAVSVTANGCADTSSCFNISGLGIGNLVKDEIALYPNPTYGDITVSLGNNFVNTFIVIYSADGKMVERKHANAPLMSFALTGEKGIYFVNIISEDKTTVVKVMKN